MLQFSISVAFSRFDTIDATIYNDPPIHLMSGRFKTPVSD